MSATDPISDMLTRIRNAQQIGKEYVLIPISKAKKQIADILCDEGYVESCEVVGENKLGQHIKINLKYYENRSVIEKIYRVSKPGKRVYVGKEDIPQICQGLGVSILSTNLGIMSSRVAKKKGIGGEVICGIF
jgi:small subunit ribosomal protein S8